MNGGSAAAGVDPRVERSRTVIRQAALEELAEVGFGAFTIESVAARAHAGKSTIYRHWRDKVDLIADAFENAHEHMVPGIATGTATERITLLVRHVAEVVVHSTFSRCIPALIEGAQHDPRLREFHHGYSAQRRSSLTELIIEGTGSGEFAASIDPELAVQAILGTVFYGRLMSAEPFDPARARELVEAVLRPCSNGSPHPGDLP
jgi:AcrR family transcriptional regulator